MAQYLMQIVLISLYSNFHNINEVHNIQREIDSPVIVYLRIVHHIKVNKHFWSCKDIQYT